MICVLVALQNRANQQQQQQTMNNTMTFSNLPTNHPQQVSAVNPMINQTARFPAVQSTPRMSNPIGSTVVSSMPPGREPPKFNPGKITEKFFHSSLFCSFLKYQRQVFLRFLQMSYPQQQQPLIFPKFIHPNE